MLQPEQSPYVRSSEAVAEEQTLTESVGVVLDFLRRQYRPIAIAVAIAIALGFIYLLTTPPTYTAAASLLIDTKNVQLFQRQSAASDMPIDTGMVESQVEILKSETIALAVIDKLHLDQDPEFLNPPRGLVSTLLGVVFGLFSSHEPASDFVIKRAAVGAFQSRLEIKRVGLTYVISVGFRLHNPDRAAQIANEVANAYIDDQLESTYAAARRAGTWLQARLRELRDQASTAERAVVAFKTKHDIVDAGGRTINDQQLAELNSELVVARSKTGEAKARLDRVQAVLQKNSPETTVSATVADTLKNDVIIKLRSQYLELARREADWTPRYGSNHLAVINIRNQMRELQNSIHDELQRIAETYKSDAEIAKQQEDSLQKQLDRAVTQSQVTNEAQVALRELESNSQTYRALYDNFLQRYMESVQQQSFPITDARLISVATRPLGKSGPKTTLILGAAAFVGLAFGLAVGAWRTFADRVFRTASQVEATLQTDCIALVPSVSAQAMKASFGDASSRDISEHGEAAIPLAQHARLLAAGYQTIMPVDGLYSAVVEEPFSPLAEAIRSIKVAIDLSPAASGGRITGITSSVPNEGKSSIAAAAARLLAQSGARTLLIDCDLRNPSLSRLLSPKAKLGLLDVVSGSATLEKAIWIDPVTHLMFLPASIKGRYAHSSEILGSAALRKFFDTSRQNYDYVIADFAPLRPIVDVRAATNLVDSYLYVVEWGSTHIDLVSGALRSARNVYDHLLGVVLNKVDLKALGRYDGRGADYHLMEYYYRYGHTPTGTKQSVGG
jgi:succinoglycan biosynthesis transport protein ExoP